MIFGYGGTLGEPEIFEALVGRPVKWEKRRIDGLELVFQPFEKINPLVRERLQNWEKGEFYGAFSLRAGTGAKTKVTFYEVDDEYSSRVVISRLAEWNMHDLGWFKLDKLEGNVDGKTVEFQTEILIGEDVLQTTNNWETRSRYIRFAREMLRRLKATFPRYVEGQQSVGTERVI